MLALLAASAGAEPLVPAALPHAQPFGAELRERLGKALEEQGRGAAPRTKHLDSAGRPLYTNRLLLEKSPYLRQHAHNPVDWFPWGAAAFERARALDRPVLLSIGYSTCHWCHVMEEESFDDVETARLLNREFVAIKVDRELRPDIDSIYMSAARALGQGGGWPLNVWLTADRMPFYAGTYFPPDDRDGRPGFRRVLTRVAEVYASDRARLDSIGARVQQALRAELELQAPPQSTLPDEVPLRQALERYQAAFDPVAGGLQGQTKFPSALPVPFLLREYRRMDDPRPLQMVRRTLDEMARGGIHDHLAGGFHRYTTDPRWLVPHFEKMLYDNALLLRSYTEAWQATGDPEYERVVRSLVGYLESGLRAPTGAFYSATDADSATPSGELEEGRYFTWTPDEIAAALPVPEASAAMAWFGVTGQGQLDGRSILHTSRDPSEVARELGLNRAQLDASIESARRGLLAARSRRAPPLRDDKILVAWNALAISGLARAGFAFGRTDWITLAAAAARAVLAGAWHEGALSRAVGSTPTEAPAVLDDPAFLVAALLDLFEIQGAPDWFASALEIQAWQDAEFMDRDAGGYFATGVRAERLLAREKPARDGAIPSGNSLSAANLLRLHALTTDPAWSTRAGLLFSAFQPVLEQDPTAMPELLIALDFQLEPTREIAIVLPESGAAADAAPLLRELRRRFLPNRALLTTREGRELDALAQTVPWLAGKTAQGGRPTAYVCIAQVCKLPTTEPDELRRQLDPVLHQPPDEPLVAP